MKERPFSTLQEEKQNQIQITPEEVGLSGKNFKQTNGGSVLSSVKGRFCSRLRKQLVCTGAEIRRTLQGMSLDWREDDGTGNRTGTLRNSGK